jgi:hypothetical protein
MNTEQFFHIEIDLLKDQRIFPFHLYVFHPISKEYFLYLNGNEPLVKDKEKLLHFIFEKGGSIAIKLAQKQTFLASLSLTENDVPSLRKNEVLQMKVEQQQLKAKQVEKDKEKPFLFKQEFNNAIEGDNFMPLIDRVREEVMCLPVTISATVSLARFLAEDLLNKDNMINRIASVSFMLSKGMGIVDPASLGDLFCASMLHHLGLTQIERSLLNRPQIQLSDDDRKRQRQHAGLSHHLLKKCQIELSDRCLKLLQEHHERNDGSGFPNAKKGEHLDVLSLALGAVSHLFEYHYGHITGQLTPIKSILSNMKNNKLTPGLEVQFGELVLSNLTHLSLTASTDSDPKNTIAA